MRNLHNMNLLSTIITVLSLITTTLTKEWTKLSEISNLFRVKATKSLFMLYPDLKIFYLNSHQHFHKITSRSPIAEVYSFPCYYFESLLSEYNSIHFYENKFEIETNPVTFTRQSSKRTMHSNDFENKSFQLNACLLGRIFQTRKVQTKAETIEGTMRWQESSSKKFTFRIVWMHNSLKRSVISAVLLSFLTLPLPSFLIQKIPFTMGGRANPPPTPPLFQKLLPP